MNPDLSIVIPTYNRTQLLRESIKSLLNQSLDSNRYEIIVVDDGSKDETAEMLTELINQTTHPLRVYTQKNKLSGSARNLGIQEAHGNVILSMDDDNLANPKLLEQHLDLHYKYPELETVVVGKVITGNSGIDK